MLNNFLIKILLTFFFYLDVKNKKYVLISFRNFFFNLGKFKFTSFISNEIIDILYIITLLILSFSHSVGTKVYSFG